MNRVVLRRVRMLVSTLTLAMAVAVAGASAASAAYPGSNGVIAYQVNSQIQTINADGTGSVDVSDNPSYEDDYPQWSADGQTIVFTRCCPNNLNQIYTMSANGSNQTNISNDGFSDYEPTISPSGSQVAFIRGGNLWTMSSTGASKTELTSMTIQRSRQVAAFFAEVQTTSPRWFRSEAGLAAV